MLNILTLKNLKVQLNIVLKENRNNGVSSLFDSDCVFQPMRMTCVIIDGSVAMIKLHQEASTIIFDLVGCSSRLTDNSSFLAILRAWKKSLSMWPHTSAMTPGTTST